MDQAGGFAHGGVGAVKVACCHTSLVVGAGGIGLGAQGVDAAFPLAVQAVSDGAKVVRGRPIFLAQDVKHRAAGGAVAIGDHRLLFGRFAGQAFAAGPQARANQRAVGPQGQRRRQTAPIGHAPGGQQQGVRRVGGQPIGGLGHQGKGATAQLGVHAVAAGFHALHHHHRCSGFHCPGHLRQALHLAHQWHTCCLQPGAIGAWVSERQHDGRGPPVLVEHGVQGAGVLVQTPGDEAAAQARQSLGLTAQSL